jgi:two-component system C4-dicarboxylate transport sensor histidine kinase DctB
MRAHAHSLLAAFVSVAVGIALLWLWHAEKAALTDRLALAAREQGEVLDRRIASFRLAPRLLADDPRLVGALHSPGAVPAANRLLARAQAETGLAFVFLMGRDGLTIASSNHADEVSFIGQNYGFRPYFQGAVEGHESRHFAVGATTGRPGYFVAVPVFAAKPIGESAGDSVGHRMSDPVREPVDDPVGSDLDWDEPIGVVVGKLELDELIASWRTLAEHTLVLDSRGVSILSTREDLLYLPSQPLTASVREQIEQERAYALVTDTRLRLMPAADPHAVSRVDRVSSVANTVTWVASGRELVNARWSVFALVPRSVLWLVWLRDVLALSALAAIVALVLRVGAQRRRITQVRASQANELERLVDLRTRELESAQRALIARSNFEMLGRMSAAINHEINQPLASLRLDLASARTLLARPSPDVAAVSEVVVDADRTTKRIGRVIETLRRVAGPSVDLGEQVSLDKLLADIVDTIKRERPVMSSSLHASTDAPTVGFIDGNAVLLQQALLNLVYNAFDAVADVDEPMVQLHCYPLDENHRANAGGIGIAVTDNGAGVPEQLQDQLFEPFAKDPGTVSGLGLGLALAQEIAVRHGGQIVHYPQETGTRFELQLPIERSDRSAP